MKVILTGDVSNLGKRGDIKEVSEGYARNYLIPKKLVMAATEKSISEIEKKKAREKQAQAENLDKLKKAASEIKGKEIIIKSKNRKGKLFGSIGSKEIFTSLGLSSIDLDEKSIRLNTPIKKLGEYKIKLKLAPDVEAEILLLVQDGN
jgi:large subunit ribosomal protein L9